MSDKNYRLKEIEFRITKLKHTLEGLIPIWTQVDRKVSSIKAELDRLEDEKCAIDQGQIEFDPEASF
jgi:uncharacterized coiled-coil protein SlyX